MAYWVDIADGIIEAGDPCLAEIAAALRGNDLCNGSKPLPLTYTTAWEGSASNSVTYVENLSFWLRIPDDVPEGWVLDFPVQAIMTGTGGVTGRILANTTLEAAPEQYIPIAGTYSVLLVIPNIHRHRGTEVEVIVQVRVSETAGTIKARAALGTQAARLMVRRP